MLAAAVLAAVVLAAAVLARRFTVLVAMLEMAVLRRWPLRAGSQD